MMLHWLTSPEWANTVKALLHTLWQGAIIAVLLGMALRRLDSSVLRYRCSLAALVGIMLAGLVTWAVLNRPVLQPVSNSPASQNQRAAAPEANNNLPPLVVNFPPGESKPVELRWTAWLALLWLAGAIGMLGRAGIQVAGAERLRRSSRPLDDPHIANLLAEARRAVGLARRVRIAVTDKLTSPAVVGVLVPTLVLPLSLTTTLTPEQIRFVLLHELAHIRRGDYFANLFQLFVEALLFFNPAVWWISRQLRVEREVCCDTLAIELSGAPADYARTLVHVAENVLSSAPVAAPAFGDNRGPSSLTDRVQRLLVPGYRPALRLTWRAMLVALLAGGTLLFLSAFGTRVTVAAILSPQERIAQIEKKMSEYGQQSKPDDEDSTKIEISGHVRTADHSPLPDHWRVDFHVKTGHGGIGSGPTENRDGSFKGTVRRGILWVSAGAPGFAPFALAAMDIRTSNRVENLELVLPRGFDVSVLAVDDDTGKPIPNATMLARFWFPSPTSVGDPYELTTDTNGVAILEHGCNLPLVVTVNAPGYEILEKRFESVQPNIPLRIPLRAGIKVSGLVLDKVTGQPLNSATIQVRHEKGPTQQNYPWDNALRIVAKTDANGQFTANQLRSDTVYWLGVSAPGHESVIVDRVSPGANNLTVRLGPEMVVSGRVLGSLKGLQIIDNDYTLYRSTREVFDGNSYGDGGWVRLYVTNGVTTFQFTNRVAGVVSLSTRDGKGFERQVDAPVKDWLIDLTETQGADATNLLKQEVIKREVVLRFTHPSGVAPKGTVYVTVPYEMNAAQPSFYRKEVEIQNGGVRVPSFVGAMFDYEPAHTVGYWFKRDFIPAISNGPGPLVIDVPVIPAGAIYARAKNADGTPAGGLFFSAEELKCSPLRADNSSLADGSDSINDNAPRKWVSGPLPLGGTYQIIGWRGNSFCASQPVTLTESQPDAEVELQFPPGQTFTGEVMDADGRPVRGGEIGVEFSTSSSHSFQLKPVFTDENGRFRVDDTTPGIGKYSLSFHCPDCRAEMFEVNFSRLPVKVKLQPGLMIAGQVVEAATGCVIPNAEIRAWTEGGTLPQQTTHTDADGRFEFTTLGDATYHLYVEEANYEMNFRPEFKAGQATNLVLKVTPYRGSKLKPKALPARTDSETAVPATMMFKIDRPTDADSLKRLLLDAGVKLPPTVYFYTDNGLLLVRGDQEQLTLVNSAVLKLNGYLPKEKAGEKPVNRGLLPTTNPYATTNIVHTGDGREVIYSKLNRIQFDKVSWPEGLPLSEVLRNLNDQTKFSDPDKKGINFTFHPNAPAASAATASAGSGEAVDASSINVKLKLTNMRLADLLDAIVVAADHPIKYSILDDSIVFSTKGSDSPPLETRTFKVDASVFLAALQKQTGLQTNVSAAMRQLLSNVGLDLSPPKTIFFNHGLGVLFVRATGQDLDVVEKAVQVLTYTPPPQFHIKARFIEVPEAMTANLGANFIPTSITNVTGILTDPNFRLLVHNLEQSQGTETLAEPEVTTVSGRQTQMRATDILTIITNFVFQETSTNSAITPQTTQVEVGPVLDVIPVVLPDGYTIDLTAIPSLTEFLGYDKPPTNSTPVVTSKGAIVNVPTVLPRFRVRQAVTHLKLWDDQTVVLGSLQDRLVPGGKEVDVKPGSEAHKQLFVFVTVTLVDRAGNRIHSDDEIARKQHSAAGSP